MVPTNLAARQNRDLLGEQQNHPAHYQCKLPLWGNTVAFRSWQGAQPKLHQETCGPHEMVDM